MIKLHEPTFGEEEIAAAVDVMRSTMVTQGEKVAEFEEAFATKFGYERAVACNSGSSANLLAITAMSRLLEPGDEVYVPALAWPTTVWPVIQCGLIPVFCDADPWSLNMNIPAPVEEVKAAVPISVYGNPYRGNTWNLPTVFDNCEALGAHTATTLSTYSFYYSHHMTTFEGGMVGVDDIKVADQMRALRSHGWIRDREDKAQIAAEHPRIDPKFLFIDMGYNLRMTEVAAAIGLVQLEKLDEIVTARQLNHAGLLDVLSKHKDLTLQRMPGGSSPFGFAMTIRDKAAFNRKTLSDWLTKNGIENRPIIAGNMANQPAMKKFPHRVATDLSVASHIMTHGLSIGCHQGMTESSVAYIEGVFDRFMRIYS